MRLIGDRHLLLGAVLIAAGSAAAAIPPSSVTDARDPARQAAYCAAFLSIDVRPPQSVDRRHRAAALNAWRAGLRRLRPDDAGQYFGAAQAASDNESLDARRDAAAYCEARAPIRRRR